MSPRSEEFIRSARRALGAARREVDEFPERAISSAYYGMLYAARAALSEEDRYAKTHRGVWDLFHLTFVATGRFDAALARQARESQALRERSDYDAAIATKEEGEAIVEFAARYLDAVATMLDG